jgi:MFS family permease
MENGKTLPGGVRIYSYRFVVLAAYLIVTVMIQLLWATFFSVTTSAWKFYGFTDAAAGENAISLLSIIFMVGMIVLSIPSLAVFEKWGFKKSVGFGALLMGVFGLVRGFFGDSYAVVVAATVGFSVAQPFILNAPGLVAGKWFPENERATANGIGLLANYLGMAIGLLVTPVILDGGATIKDILLIYGVAAAVAAVLFLIFAKEAPPTPPCSEEEAFRSSFGEGVKTALKKKDFLFSILMLFCLLGVFNTFFTMIEPLLASMTGGTLDSTAAGIVGVVILFTGIVGSFAVSMISDKDKLQRRLPYMIACNVIGLIGFVLFLLLGDYTGMLIAGVLYGLFTVGSAPVILTFAAEAAYPTSEGTSEGLLMFAGNVGGVLFLGLASLFAGNHRGIMIALSVAGALSVGLMLLSRETKLSNRKNMKKETTKTV